MTETLGMGSEMCRRWRWPLDLTQYDRDPRLRSDEQDALAVLVQRMLELTQSGRWPTAVRTALDRLTSPIDDVFRMTATGHWRERYGTVHLIVQEMHQRQTAYWAWSREDWLTILIQADLNLRQYVMAIAYVLGGYRDLHVAFPFFGRQLFVWRLFGRKPVDAAVRQVNEELIRWGYTPSKKVRSIPPAVWELLLHNGSPYLEDLTPEIVTLVQKQNRPERLHQGVPLVARALIAMGILAPTPEGHDADAWLEGTAAAQADVPQAWGEWCQRYYRTSTLSISTRQGNYYYLLKVGRWLLKTHPDVSRPDQWTRELAIEWVAAVDRMKIGEWTHAPTTFRLARQTGGAISARTKDTQLAVVRTFFRDCQDWGWIPRRFDPARVFTTPRAVRALIGPDPRVIADDVWAKLLWAGLNLTQDDLPHHQGRRTSWYPLEMTRAVAVVWLFAGLRVDELVRLRLDCIRWQREDVTVAVTTSVLPKDAVCLLDVPAHKSGTPFTKPVDRAVGEAINAWERIRPTQPPFVDPKTAELVHVLFAYRGARLSRSYLNRVLIPVLCRKANVPPVDARGNITSHRARSTIATQLFNAKDPLSLFELQEWLGHRSPVATQQYAKIAPTRLAKAYADAGYFGRNLRTISVLVDQEVIKSGAASGGEPWRFYDLGHGYCTYDFFDQCPHRMACAKCAFYAPKGSSQAQILEGKGNLLRMLQEIPLTEEEQAAIEDGVAAFDHLLTKLRDVPTPAGPTPRQLDGRLIVSLQAVPGPSKTETQ